jgi:hypothetical protein
MPSYSEDFIRDRVGSGKDAERARSADELVAKAKAGDPAALAQLKQLADLDSEPGGGWATPDARNYTRLAMQEAGLVDGSAGYMEKGDGGGFLGSVKSVGGDLLKYGAPVAAMAIPGIGPLAAAGIAAGGNTLGRAVKGDPFSLQSLVLSGAAGAGGNMLLGGQGFKGISSIGQRMGMGGAAPGGAAPGAASPALTSQGVMAPGGGTIGAVGGAGGVANAAGSGFSMGKAMDAVERFGPLVVGGLGAYQTMQDQSKANALRDRGIAMAEKDYDARAPFRMRASEFATMPMPSRPDLSSIFNDPGNPYNRVRSY